jgi:hypothetical protein
MPLILRLISYFSGNEDGVDSTIFNERLKNSLKLLERRAENNIKEKFDWKVPSAYVPFRFTVVSVVKEPDAQTDDDDDDDIPSPSLKRIQYTTSNNEIKRRITGHLSYRQPYNRIIVHYHSD